MVLLDLPSSLHHLSLFLRRSLNKNGSTNFFKDKAFYLIGLDQLNKWARLEMKNPYCISITEIFILYFLSCLIKADRKLLFFFFRSGPCIEYWLFLEIEVIVFDFQALVNFDIEVGGRIEGYVNVDVLLVVEARFKIENAILSGNLK